MAVFTYCPMLFWAMANENVEQNFIGNQNGTDQLDSISEIQTKPSKHGQMGPIWAESGHYAQIGPMWVPYRNFSQCGTHMGPI